MIRTSTGWHWMALDVAVIKVPEVCSLSVFLQGMPRVICSCKFCLVSRLELLEQKRGASIFICKSLPRLFTPIHGTVPAAYCPATWNRASATIPRARLQSRGPATSPCSAPRSFGIGFTPSCTTEERARCFHPAAAGVFGEKATCPVPAFHSIILNCFFVNFDPCRGCVQ